MAMEQPWKGRRLHFVGAGGCGMSGLALIAAQLGAGVTASDRSESLFTDALEQAGIGVAIGHRSENVPSDAEIVVSAAIPLDNIERSAGRRRGQREMQRSSLLAELSRLRRCVAVAGTHGKTTTTAMLVHMLECCGMDPAFVVGGLLRSAGGHARWGTGPLVIEADESDRSLLKYDVDVAVLLNAELDHHAHYENEQQVHEVFAAFLEPAAHAVLPPEPALLALRSGPVTIVPPVARRRIESGRQLFAVGDVDVELPLPGAHNAANAAAAIATAEVVGASRHRAAEALATFPGIARRFEFAGRSNAGASVFDDYGHHPTEVRATVDGVRELASDRLIVVFQPHLFSRTQHFATAFADALRPADVVVVCDVYPARERAEDWPGVSGRLISDALAGDTDVRWAATLDEASRLLDAELAAPDVCLVIGAGDVGTLARRLVEADEATITR